MLFATMPRFGKLNRWMERMESRDWHLQTESLDSLYSIATGFCSRTSGTPGHGFAAAFTFDIFTCVCHTNMTMIAGFAMCEVIISF